MLFVASLTNYFSLVHPVGRHHTQLPRNNPNALSHVSQSHAKLQSNATNSFSTNPISHSLQLPTKHRCMTPHEPDLYINLNQTLFLSGNPQTHKLLSISSLNPISLYKTQLHLFILFILSTWKQLPLPTVTKTVPSAWLPPRAVIRWIGERPRRRWRGATSMRSSAWWQNTGSRWSASVARRSPSLRWRRCLHTTKAWGWSCRSPLGKVLRRAVSGWWTAWTMALTVTVSPPASVPPHTAEPNKAVHCRKNSSGN